MNKKEKEMWDEVIEDFKDLSKNNVLIGKDKKGTEYWAPKKMDLELCELMEARMVAQQKNDVIRHWIQLKVELRELLGAAWWYWRRNIVLKRYFSLEAYISTFLEAFFGNTLHNT